MVNSIDSGSIVSKCYTHERSRDIQDIHHARMLTTNLFHLQQSNLLCDITLVCGGMEIAAHRVVLAACSQYFQAMFTGGMCEVAKTEIPLKNVDTDALTTLVDYAYSGILRINEKNVQIILETADLLQFHTAKSLCCDFIKDNININNCLEIYQFAEIYNCESILNLSQNLFNYNWKKLLETESFLNIDLDILLNLIGDDSIAIRKEIDIVEIIVTWIEASLPERYHYLPLLLKHIRWSYLSPKDLLKLQNYELIKNCNKSQDIVQNYMDTKLFIVENVNMRYSYASWIYMLGGEQSFLREMKSCEFFNQVNGQWEYGFSLHGPRTSFAAVVQGDKLYVIGGMRFGEKLRLVECFNPKEGRWKRLSSLKKCLGDVEAAIVDDVVYVAGGSSVGEPACRYVEKYDESNNTWLSLPNMKYRRRRFGMCQFKSKLYVFAGFQDSVGELRACEVFDPDINRWESMTPLQTSRCDLGVSVLSDCIYICGGVNSYSGSISSVEKYNPATDTWISCGNMNHARGGHALISYMGRILAIGGVNSYMQTCKDAEWYNEVTGEWYSLPPTNMPRFGGAAVVLPYCRGPKTYNEDESNDNG